jgi:pyridoxamine 5'-phosphate oxidase
MLADSPTNVSNVSWSPADAQAHSDRVWALAFRGVVDRRSCWHTPTLATQSETGAPDLRTVVLRGASHADWTMRFHTDVRSGKFAQLKCCPLVAVHVYDPGHKLQVRIFGNATLHAEDDIAERAWAATQPMGRVGYAQEYPPGATVNVDRLPRLSISHNDARARNNFAVIVIQAERIDWLSLAAEGHSRAQLERNNCGTVTGHWLAP